MGFLGFDNNNIIILLVLFFCLNGFQKGEKGEVGEHCDDNGCCRAAGEERNDCKCNGNGVFYSQKNRNRNRRLQI